MEVLVAMMILGTAIAALLGLLSGSLSNLRRVESARRASMLGQATLNELLIPRGLPASVSAADAAEPALRLGETISGSWDSATRWEARATALKQQRDAAGPQHTPVNVEFTVYWRREQSGPENKLVLETTQLGQRAQVGN